MTRTGGARPAGLGDVDDHHADADDLALDAHRVVAGRPADVAVRYRLARLEAKPGVRTAADAVARALRESA